MGNIVGAIILGVIAVICFIFSYLQFNEKGFLLNNAYIYASKQERKNMDKNHTINNRELSLFQLELFF